MSETASVWFLYSAALLGLLMIVRQSVLTVLPPLGRWFVLCTLLPLLAAPVAVPGTSALAPAWLVALFESLFGDADAVNAALRIIVLLLAVSYAMLLLVVLRRRRPAAA